MCSVEFGCLFQQPIRENYLYINYLGRELLVKQKTEQDILSTTTALHKLKLKHKHHIANFACKDKYVCGEI